jgi:hypothetical protein
MSEADQPRVPTREEMLPIMDELGVLDHLDIADDDFRGGHGRERFYVRVFRAAYAAGFKAASE